MILQNNFKRLFTVFTININIASQMQKLHGDCNDEQLPNIWVNWRTYQYYKLTWKSSQYYKQ